MTSVRTRIALSAVLLGATLVAGCTVTTQNCRNGLCSVSLEGDGAATTLRLGGGDVRVVLRQVSGGKATVTLDGGPVTLGAGESGAVKGLRVECRAVDGDKVTLIVRS